MILNCRKIPIGIVLVKHMRRAILTILITVLLAGYSSAAGDQFPSKSKASFSPNGRFQAYAIVSKPPSGEGEEMPWYELRLKDTATDLDRPVKKFIRSLDVLWAPDNKHFAVTFWWGSNVSWVEVYPSEGNMKAVNPYDIIARELGELPEVKNISRSYHSYFEALKWLDNQTLLINAYGHWDQQGTGGFDYYSHRFEVKFDDGARPVEENRN